MNFENRIRKLRALLKDKEAILVSQFINIQYLTGFITLSPEERESWVIVTKKSVYILSSILYKEELEHHTKDSLFTPCILSREKRLTHYLKEIVEKENIEHFLFESENLKYNEFEALQKTGFVFKPSSELIIALRAIKDKEEIENLKKACELIDVCLADIAKEIKIGTSEKEVAFKLEYWVKENGHESAFTPIVAIDENSSKPHHQNSDKKVTSTSLILIDYGVRYKGYNSDITRMFFMKDTPKNILSEYEKLLSAQEVAIEKLSQSEVYSEVDNKCRKKLDEYSLPQYPHTTGHGVGLELHEYPKVSHISDEKITPGHILTIEPGIYYEGKYGMRIEDTVLIDENKKTIPLTTFSKEIYILR